MCFIGFIHPHGELLCSATWPCVRCVSQLVEPMEELRAMCITLREVKFSDLLEANRSKGVRQSQVCQSRTRVWGTKMIRYRCSPLAVNYASSLLVLDSCLATTSGVSPPSSRNPSLWVQGGVPSQEGNLKELTERHHQAWSLRDRKSVV